MPRQKSTHVDSPHAVGRRLNEARSRAGLSQRQLAFPGCSPAYISRIEAGQRIPSLQLLRELGRRLGVSEDHLATGAEREAEAREPLVEAEVALRLDELELAERLYTEALESAASTEERAGALAGLGQLAFRTGDPRAAIERLEQALELSDSAVIGRPASADTLGRAYATVGDLTAAIGLFERCLHDAEERNDPIETFRFAVLLSNALIDSGNFGRAQELLGRTVARAHETGDPILRARLYWSQSRLHALQQDPATAARYARKALEILELTEHTHYTARAHLLLAVIELDRGQADDALELLSRGKELLAASGNRIDEALFQLEEARALAQLGQGERAAALAMEVSGLLADADPLDAGRSYALLAQIFKSRGEAARARELYELAAELLEPVNAPMLTGIYVDLAELLEAEGRKDEALELLKKALGAQARTGSPRT